MKMNNWICISSLKERSTDIEFVDFDDHDEVSDISEGEILFKLRYR